MLKFLKKLFSSSKNELKEETRTFQGEVTVLKLNAEESEAYLANWFLGCINNGNMKDYQRVHQFVDRHFKQLETNHEILDLIKLEATEPMRKIAHQFFTLHMKCEDNDLIEYLDSIR